MITYCLFIQFKKFEISSRNSLRRLLKIGIVRVVGDRTPDLVSLVNTRLGPRYTFFLLRIAALRYSLKKMNFWRFYKFLGIDSRGARLPIYAIYISWASLLISGAKSIIFILGTLFLGLDERKNGWFFMVNDKISEWGNKIPQNYSKKNNLIWQFKVFEKKS